MKPGRELDALIAEKVMGEEVVKTPWKNKRGEGFYYTLGEPFWNDYAGAMDLGNPLPPYSTDIAAAWLVVEKLNGLQYSLNFNDNFNFEFKPEPRAAFTRLYGTTEYVSGESAPHAICLAALKAVGFELQK